MRGAGDLEALRDRSRSEASVPVGLGIDDDVAGLPPSVALESFQIR